MGSPILSSSHCPEATYPRQFLIVGGNLEFETRVTGSDEGSELPIKRAYAIHFGTE